MDFEKLQQIIPKDPIKWTTDDVGKWLNFIGLQQYFQAFKLATIDGACLSHITEEDLIHDLGISSNIIRKKLMNWFTVGIKEFSIFLKGEQGNIEQEQITYSDMPFNVFSKQCLENDFKSYQYNNMVLENANVNKNGNFYENNEAKYDMMTGNVNLNRSSNNIEIEEPTLLQQQKPISENNYSFPISTSFPEIMQNENLNILTENNQINNLNNNNNSNQIQNQDNYKAPKAKAVLQNKIQRKISAHTPNCYNNNRNKINSLLQQDQLEIEKDEETKCNNNYINNNKNQNQYYPKNTNNENNFSGLIQKQQQMQQQQVLQPQQRTSEEPEKDIIGKEQSLIQQYQLSKKLIIQPSDGPQTNFYCINENGGKIGRHSSNQILILEESISRFHAEIVFEKGQFGIKDIGSTTGSFIKITHQLHVVPGMILEMGSNQFQVQQCIPKNSKGFAELNLKIIEGTNIGLDYNMQFENSKKRYSLGRKANNEFSLPDDHHLSNQHCRFYFIDNKFILEDLSSTNGSWMRIAKEGEESSVYPLNDKTVFKIGTTSTYVCKIEQEQVSEKSSDNMCIICCESDRDALYLPCKHNTACVKCSKNLKECPICRLKIEDFIKIYKA